MVLHGIARNAKRRRYLAISLALGRMRENIDPYPVYLHCWMITIDCIGTIPFWMLLSQHLNVADIVGGAWVFVLFSCGLPVWVFMEAKSIIHDIKDETSRQIYFGGQVTPGTKASEAQARTWCLGMIAVSFFVNAYALSMLGGFSNCAIFLVWPFTNYVFALWTWRFWSSRAAENNSRKYQSMARHYNG